MTEPSAAVQAAIKRRQAEGPDEDALEKIRVKAREAKDLEKNILDYEEMIKQIKVRLANITFNELVDLMQKAGVDNVGVPAQGNMPAFDAKLKDYYSASIPADAPEPFRTAAFAALTKSGNEDLIKTTLIMQFPKEERKRVATFIKRLPKNVTYETKAMVHKGTLTKWLREYVQEKKKPPPFLEKINGKVGYIVELKDRKE